MEIFGEPEEKDPTKRLLLALIDELEETRANLDLLTAHLGVQTSGQIALDTKDRALAAEAARYNGLRMKVAEIIPR